MNFQSIWLIAVVIEFTSGPLKSKTEDWVYNILSDGECFQVM